MDPGTLYGAKGGDKLLFIAQGLSLANSYSVLFTVGKADLSSHDDRMFSASVSVTADVVFFYCMLIIFIILNKLLMLFHYLFSLFFFFFFCFISTGCVDYKLDLHHSTLGN